MTTFREVTKEVLVRQRDVQVTSYELTKRDQRRRSHCEVTVAKDLEVLVTSCGLTERGLCGCRRKEGLNVSRSHVISSRLPTLERLLCSFCARVL